MSENIVGPFGPGVNATTTRPDDTESGSGTDTWFKPCEPGNPATGTTITAIWLNKVTALLRRAIRGMGVPDNESDDDMLLKALQQADKTVANNASATGVGVFQEMDPSGLVHLLRKIIGTNGIAVGVSADDDRIEIDGSALGGGPAIPLNWKLPCRVAATANVANLATAAPNVINGVNLAANDRILLAFQTAPAENGIYLVQTLGTGSNGVWVRASDFDSDADAVPNTYVPVSEGTAYADSLWQLTTNAAITLGTTALAFAKVFPIDVMGASGPSHKAGLVGDPGATAGTTLFWREDGVFALPGALLPDTDIGCLITVWANDQSGTPQAQLPATLAGSSLFQLSGDVPRLYRSTHPSYPDVYYPNPGLLDGQTFKRVAVLGAVLETPGRFSHAIYQRTA